MRRHTPDSPMAIFMLPFRFSRDTLLRAAMLSPPDVTISFAAGLMISRYDALLLFTL